MNKSFLLTGLALMMSSLSAHADTRSSTLTNTVTVENMCTLATTQNLNFGSYNPLNDSVGTRAVGQVQLYCNPGRRMVYINNGANSQQTFIRKVPGLPTGSGNYSWYYDCQRKMKNNLGQTLSYSLYTDAGYASQVSNEQGGSGTNSNNGGFTCGANSTLLKYADFDAANNTPQSIYLYGEIAPNQGSTATSGVYSDSIVIHVTF